MSDNHWMLGLVLALLIGGCATTSAPDDWTSDAQTMQQETYGAWVDASYGDPNQPQMVRGELIAVSPDSVHVLPLDSTLQSVARPTINELQMVTFDANWGYLATWTALGTLSTLSHGFILIFSAPVWIIGGSAATGTQSYRPVFTNPDTETLRTYARFPQGWPPSLDRQRLRSKPVE